MGVCPDNGVYGMGARDQLGELTHTSVWFPEIQNATSCNTSLQWRVARRRTFATDSGWLGWGTVGGAVGGRSFLLQGIRSYGTRKRLEISSDIPFFDVITRTRRLIALSCDVLLLQIP